MNSIKMNLLISILFLIFSISKSKELLEEWEYNTQNKIESSPFISFAINNITDTKIYVAKEYLLLFNKDIIKNITNNKEITSINSPLIEYNQDYYFCTNSNLYKIGNENSQLEEIGFNNSDSIKSLKCNKIITYGSQYIFVGLIGTNSIFTYRLSNRGEENYQQLPGEIIAISSYNIDTYISHHAIFYKNYTDNKYILQIFKCENNDALNPVHQSILSDYSNFEFTDNSTIKISFLTDKIILIISYIKNEELHFYHFDFGSNILQLVGGNSVLRSFNQYTVINADFLENTPYIYYIIERTGRYYLGVADLKYYIIVYNIEITEELNIIYDEGYFYQSKLFLNYFEGTIHKLVCPFVLNSTLCQHELEGKYLTINNEYSSSGLYKNYFSETCSNGKIIGNYCLKNCPIGSSDSGKGTCSQCPYNVFFNYGDKKCSEVCNFKFENKICYNCESAGQIYYNNDCVKSCSEVYKIYDENIKECKDCENGKYFNTQNNECIDESECPEDFEKDDINRACINCEQFEMYSLNISGKILCYKKCPINYYPLDNKCILCDSGKYQNGKCVENCSPGYIEIDNNCISCKENRTIQCGDICTENCSNCANYIFEENGVCVSDCSEGYSSNDNNICESCLEKGLFYYKEECKGKCADFGNYLAWNETDHICKFCKDIDENLFFEDNKCVKECKETARKLNSICFTCEEHQYYFYGQCNKTCPIYTVPNKIQYTCTYCPDDTYFFNNKCLKQCKEPYFPTDKDSHKVCDICPEGYWYTLKKCLPKCEEGCYSLEEERTCHLCFCNDQGECLNNHTSECKCNDQYFGKNCEFYRKNSENQLIIPLYNKALRTNVSFYSFNKEKIKFNNYKIKWQFLFERKEITSDPEYKKYFVTGTNEEIFGINPNLLSDEKNNNLHLTITSENNEKIEDEIKILAQNFYRDFSSNHISKFLDPNLQDTGLLYKPMNTKIEIEQTDYSNMNQFKYFYQFSFLDGNDEEFPLTSFNNSKEVESYYIPFARQYKVNIQNDRGELIQYKIPRDDSDIYKNLNNDDLNSKSIYDIRYDSNYNNIEKLFIFMIIFNSYEITFDEENNKLDLLFDFIKENYEKFINENGYYNISNSENSKIIYYSEPNLLFALINSIIVNQRKKLDPNAFSLILYAIKDCVDLLNKNSTKLSSKDVISLLRTIEQLHDVYNEKPYICSENDVSIFYYLFEKINNYLNSRLFPGEGIKIIGSRTILFSYNLGYYQELLAISSNNLTKPANLSNISSYSYEDYALNEESCGKNGETFLCFNRNIYKNIKEKLQLIGYEDIKNISLNIYIVNNMKKNQKNLLTENNDNNNNTQEMDNCLVHFQFYDSNQKSVIEDLVTDEKLFYSLEFSYKNEKKKTGLSQKNDDDDIFYMPYNYSKIFCYPQNYVKNKTYYCYTYFDYSINIIQCKCNIIDEIAIIENETLANFYKSLQFDTTKYTYTNKVMKYFIVIFLVLLLIPGLLFLLFDLYKINRLINANGLNYKEKRREYYQQVKSYTNTKFSFPIYSTFNIFPFCAAFNASHYTSPKFIKHLIVITAILLGFNLNLIPFYFYLPFEERQILIDKRDINIDEDEIHSIRIINKYLVRGFIFAIISLIFVHLFMMLFNKILKIDEKNRNYWRNIKEIFKDFVYLEIKKSRYLGKNFARIKNRMKAFYAVCGNYLLNKNMMNNSERKTKLENYLKFSGKVSLNNKINIKDDSKKYGSKIGTKKESLINELQENLDSINDDESEDNIINTEYKPPKINIKINSSVDKDLNISSSFGNNKNKKLGDILKHLKPMKSDSLQYSKINEIQYGISNDSICRFEKIKNKYISSNRISGSNTSKKKLNINKDSSLIVCYENNISIFNYNNYSTIIKNGIDGDNQKEFKILMLMSFILGFIFVLLITLSILFIRKLMNEYEYFMVKIWLICTISILFVAYFLIYFIKVIIGSILLFNCYHSRNNGCFIKAMFKVFVDKNLIYMYKIRNFITKYRREFINI